MVWEVWRWWAGVFGPVMGPGMPAWSGFYESVSAEIHGKKLTWPNLGTQLCP
jgi:hypothetical protein